MSHPTARQLLLFRSERLPWRTDADEEALENLHTASPVCDAAVADCRGAPRMMRGLIAALGFAATSAAGIAITEAINYVWRVVAG